MILIYVNLNGFGVFVSGVLMKASAMKSHQFGVIVFGALDCKEKLHEAFNNYGDAKEFLNRTFFLGAAFTTTHIHGFCQGTSY